MKKKDKLELSNYELWQKCSRDNNRLHYAIQLYQTIDTERGLQLSHNLYRFAERKLYNNESTTTHTYLSSLEQDMIKAIIAGDSAETFVTENIGRQLD